MIRGQPEQSFERGGHSRKAEGATQGAGLEVSLWTRSQAHYGCQGEQMERSKDKAKGGQCQVISYALRKKKKKKRFQFTLRVTVDKLHVCVCSLRRGTQEGRHLISWLHLHC